MQVNIIGTGKVATILCALLKLKGHKINAIAGRNQEKVLSLANQYECKAITEFNDPLPFAELCIIAVKDEAIPEVAKKLQLNNQILVHTSGTVSKNILEKCAKNFGVIWPLKSITEKTNVSEAFPLVIDGNSTETINQLMAFCNSISKSIHVLNDEERKKMHLAAVMANNFTNHIYSLIYQFCEEEKVPFEMLYEFIQETATNIVGIHPNKLQTGPASRNDNQTITKHLQLLEKYPSISKVYQTLSDSIQQKII